MDRGISFRVLKANRCILQKILEGVDVERYVWYIVEEQSEVWDGAFGDVFFHGCAYDGKAFKEQIAQPHLPIFLKLQVYEGRQRECRNIRTYEEFRESACQLLLLLYDCNSIECYIKEQTTLESMLEHVRHNPALEIGLITDANDMRTGMNIL